MALKFQRILFPTDFSDTSLSARQCAVGMAEAFQAQLHCLHVVDDAYLYWTAMGPEGVPLGPPLEEMTELGRKRMQQFVGEHLSKVKPAVIGEVRVGRPFAEIIGYAKEQQVDLIVLATHGRGAVAHALLGSTTEKVVRKAPCAVLTVRADGHQFAMP
ncbi:MAG: universal stress protein [Planctomycetota bacterium]